jgi:hypothetical protein
MHSQAKFFDKVFFPTLYEHGIKTVLHGGDYTDRRKYVSYGTAGWMYTHYRSLLSVGGITEVAIVGNHDCFLKHSTSINSITELYRDDDTIDIITQPTHRIFGGQDVLLLPWICDENRDASMQMIADSKAALVLGHLELAGFQMYRGLPNMDGLPAELFDKFKLVLSGHYHHRSTKEPVHYLGAPYPMTWADYRDPRGFHLLDMDTHELTFIENPYSIFNRIVYDDVDQKHSYINDLCQSIIAADSPYREAFVKVVVKRKEQPYWFDLMMDALYKVNALDVQVVDDIMVNDDGDETKTFDESALLDTVALMREYVESLSISCDKVELNKYLQGIYLEAIAANQSARLS